MDGERRRKFNKRYCVAFGCLNSNRNTPDLTLFTLPKDPERRRKWLIQIGRQDLLKLENLKYTSYEVCSAHFDESDMKIVKHIKPTAIPKKVTTKSETPHDNLLSEINSVCVQSGTEPKVHIISKTVRKKPITYTNSTQTESKCEEAKTKRSKPIIKRKRKTKSGTLKRIKRESS